MIERTLDQSSLLKDIEFNGRRAYEVFRVIPLLDVRKKCLDEMRRHFQWHNHLTIEDIEQDIRALASWNDPVWEEFLGLYVWISKSTPEGALRAVNLVQEVCGSGREGARSKMMRDVLIYNEERNYPIVRHLFIDEVYWFLAAVTDAEGRMYNEQLWHRFARAVGILLKHKDTTCLDAVACIAKALAAPGVSVTFSGTGPQEQRFLLVQHQAYVREALRQMRFLAEP